MFRMRLSSLTCKWLVRDWVGLASKCILTNEILKKEKINYLSVFLLMSFVSDGMLDRIQKEQVAFVTPRHLLSGRDVRNCMRNIGLRHNVSQHAAVRKCP